MDLVRNPGKANVGLTWADILAEDPFEGQHWEGAYGLPLGALRVDGELPDTENLDSSPSLSPLDDEIGDSETEWLSPFDTSSELESPLPTPLPQDAIPESETEQFLRQSPFYIHRDEVESFQSVQYWRLDWRPGARLHQHFDMSDPSTLSEFVGYAERVGSSITLHNDTRRRI
jgi:gamma-tubulin complex component 5